MAMLRRGKELTSREDYVIQQFPDMKRVNTIASKLFELYYIDVDPTSELSPMMRQLVPQFYVDPFNPEYPGRYVIAGKSTVPYLERVIYVTPFINDKGKYESDLSAWKGLLFNPVQFNKLVKPFRKSKLEPLVVIGEHNNGERAPQTLILRESKTKKSEQLTLPFLMLPSRAREGEEIYREALQRLVYQVFYVYILKYMSRINELSFEPIPQDNIDDLMDTGVVDIYPSTGDIISLTREVIPTLARDHAYSISKIPKEWMEDPTSQKAHYLLREEYFTKENVRFIDVYTLMAIMSIE